MTKEHEVILDKMLQVLKTSELKHKECVRRFICLSNRRLNELCKEHDGIWGGIAGKSYAIKHGYEEKFGTFLFNQF